MTTATLFNQICRPPSRRAPPPAPPGVRRILVVGGGTAGWMTALILARSLMDRGVEITLVESPTVGIIGVGEGSTPWLRGFFDSLGIDDLLERSSLNYPDHAQALAGIAPRRTDPSLQIYFW